MKASELVETVEAIIRYPRANYFELACALSFMRGGFLQNCVSLYHASMLY